MNPTAFDRLPRTLEGLPIVTLMHDPDLSQDGYLSLVDRGANGRRIRVAKAEWTTAYVNDLPDSAFLHVEPGEKDADGKTTPRSLRHFPVRDADGKVDLPHLRNALARIPQSKLPADAKRSAQSKAEGMLEKAKASKADDAGELEVRSHLGQEGGELPWWRRIFAPLLSSGTPVAKADAPTFDERILIPQVWERLYQANDALMSTIGGIMSDEEIADKAGAVDLALTQFTRFVGGLFDGISVKGEQAAEVRRISERAIAAKAGRVISRSNMGTIERAQAALEAAAEALAALVEAGSAKTDPETKVAKADPEDDSMNPEQLQKIAEAAASAAVKAAKAANPELDAAALQAVATAATAEVFKAAVAGPAQPGVPATALQTQIAESAGMNGSPKMPEGAFMNAINRLTSLTSKIAAEVLGTDENGVQIEGNPGLVAVVHKQGEALQAIAGRVQKIEGTPAPSASGGDPTTPRSKVAKQNDNVWQGSALSFSGE